MAKERIRGIVSLVSGIKDHGGKIQIGWVLKENNKKWYNAEGTEEQLNLLLNQIVQKGNEVEFNYDSLGNKVSDLVRTQKASVEEQATNRNNLKIDKKYIVSIQGKDFITYNGLLEYAKTQFGGIEKKEIVELIVSEDKKAASARVRVTMKEGQVFEDVGTCTPENVKAVKVYPEELAVTRAYSRALRFGLVVDYCSQSEVS